MTTAMYAFSGDPITYGHVDIVKRASLAFGKVVVGIGINPDKTYSFTIEERLDMAKRALFKIKNASVVMFHGLLVDYAKEHNVNVIVKGVRDATDFSYEMLLHNVGETQRQGIDTFLLPARKELVHISSSAVKALQKEQGLVHEFVPLYVKQMLEERISGQYVLGVIGTIGSGKSHVAEKFVDYGSRSGIEVHNIDLDRIGYQILGNLEEPYYRKVREEVVREFGKGVMMSNGFINRKALGEIIFSDRRALEILDAILYEPMLLRMRKEMYGKKGIILLNGALLAEVNWTYLCNNNVVLVKCDRESQVRRLRHRGLTDEQIDKRVQSQYGSDTKKEIIEHRIREDYQGALIEIGNSDNADEDGIEKAFARVLEILNVRMPQEKH
jgi:pantetheine-phosphate adenylyltransferase/dephospho-CoA kinase